jgi:hypothetical protein
MFIELADAADQFETLNAGGGVLAVVHVDQCKLELFFGYTRKQCGGRLARFRRHAFAVEQQFECNDYARVVIGNEDGHAVPALFCFAL